MNSDGQAYSIKDLENFCGIKAHTIRMWEKRYGVLSPVRSETNIREYTEDELKKLIIISILNRKGLKISRIAHLNENELLGEVKKQCQEETDKALEARLSKLIMPALRFDEKVFRNALKKIVNTSGLEDAYLKVFYPLMQRTRVLWLTDCISKPQEQFIVNEIRSLIQNEEFSLNTPADRETVTIIDLGNTEGINDLFFLKYLLRKRGFSVIYTEEKLSGSDIMGIHKVQPFRLLVLNVNPTTPDDEVKRQCNSLAGGLQLKKVLVLGRSGNSHLLNNGKTEVISHPSLLTAWAEEL